MTDPWKDKNTIWKTQSAYFTWVRGVLREGWQKYPIKANFKNSVCRKITPIEKDSGRYHGSTKYLGQCAYCGEWFPKSKLQVDHIKDSESGCKDYESAQQFMWHCLAAPSENLCLACVPCHKIKTYAERQGISFEQAAYAKYMIAVKKLSREEQIVDLFEKGYSKEQVREASSRLECYEEWFLYKDE